MAVDKLVSTFTGSGPTRRKATLSCYSRTTINQPRSTRSEALAQAIGMTWPALYFAGTLVRLTRDCAANSFTRRPIQVRACHDSTQTCNVGRGSRDHGCLIACLRWRPAAWVLSDTGRAMLEPGSRDAEDQLRWARATV